MTNNDIYGAVHDLAEQLLDAANKEDEGSFDALYTELESICTKNDNSSKDHCVQWETLADFTEDIEEALRIYEKALEKATAARAKDYMASIAFSMASLYVELGKNDAAIKSLKGAKNNASKLDDRVLKREINELLETLLS